MDALARLGLVSAYEAAHQAEVRAPTYFRWRRADLPFHIDHVFVPRRWTERLEVTVGAYEAWIASGHSDHASVIVDVSELATNTHVLG